MRIAKGRMYLRVVAAHLIPHLALRIEERGIDVWSGNPATAYGSRNTQCCTGVAGCTGSWTEGERKGPRNVFGRGEGKGRAGPRPDGAFVAL